MIDKNPYDTSIDWLAPQFQSSEQRSLYTSSYQQIPTQPVIKKAAPTKQARMPKQRALEMVNSLKKGIIVSSVVSFGLLGLLATNHIVATTTTTTKTSTPITSSKSSSSTTPSTSSSSGSSKSSSSSTSQGGFSFGSSSSQSSVSGTSVS